MTTPITIDLYTFKLFRSNWGRPPSTWELMGSPAGEKLWATGTQLCELKLENCQHIG